jgi:hypothetical protein
MPTFHFETVSGSLEMTLQHRRVPTARAALLIADQLDAIATFDPLAATVSTWLVNQPTANALIEASQTDLYSQLTPKNTPRSLPIAARVPAQNNAAEFEWLDSPRELEAGAWDAQNLDIWAWRPQSNSNSAAAEIENKLRHLWNEGWRFVYIREADLENAEMVSAKVVSLLGSPGSDRFEIVEMKVPAPTLSAMPKIRRNQKGRDYWYQETDGLLEFHRLAS